MSQGEQIATEAAAHREDLVANLPASENKQFYPALDGLRGIAVLMVFCQHYFMRPFELRWGWAGVDLFFVLSGFLITGILFDTRDTSHRFRNFYARRSLRIFPLYYGVLFAALIAAPIFRWVWHPVWLLWPIYLGNYGRFIWLHDFQSTPLVLDHLVPTRHFVSPFAFYLGHFWSLCVEEQFYLAWPLVVFRVRDRLLLRNICAASLGVCLAARIACLLFLPQTFLQADFLSRFTPVRVDSLLLGGFVALCLRGPEAARVKQWAMPVLYSIGLVFLAMQLYYYTSSHHLYYVDGSSPWLASFGLTLIDLFFAAVILRTIDASSNFFLILSNRWLRRLGQISYGFYVFHDIPRALYKKLVDHYIPSGEGRYNSLIIAAVALVGTIALSYISFRFYESPFLKLKSRFTAEPST